MRWMVLLIGMVLPAAAPAKDWPVGRGPSNDPKVFRYDPAAWKQVPADFLNDAPACYLRAETSFLLEDDGTVETITHEVIRLNSRKAVEQLGEHRNMVFNPAYEKLTLHDAIVHKPDGKTVPIEAKHVQLRDTQTDFLVYDLSKQLIISFPTLDVGDVLDVSWSVRGKNPEYAGQYFSRYQFGDEKYPVYHDELRIRSPEKKTLKYALINPQLFVGGKLDPTIEKHDGKVLYRWTTKERRFLPKEEHMPNKEELRPGLAFSTFATWDEVGDWMRKLHGNCWECTADVKKIVADETKHCKTPEEKARALTYWFRSNIRYISTGEKHDYTPHTPAVILANRYGDCKDGAQFLAVLFKEAGIPAAVASLSVRGDGQIIEALPSPAASHAILLATIDGKEHWIDTTCTFAGWDFLPYSDRDRVSYVVDTQSVRLTRTPKMTAEENKTEVDTTIGIAPDGASNVVRVSTYTGDAALHRRDEWIDEPSGERRRMITADLQEFSSRARLRRVEIDEAKLRQLDGPVTASVSFVVPEHLRGKPDLEGSVSDNLVWTNLVSTSVDWDRTLPMELDRPFESIHRYRIEAPLGYRLTDPPTSETHRSQWGLFQRTVKADEQGREWTIEFSTRVESTRIAPKDLEEFRLFQENLQRDYRAAVTLKPLQNEQDIGDDIEFLEVIRGIIPSDRTTLATLAKLYRDGNKLAEARRIVEQGLHYYPGERSLLVIAAQTAEGHAIEPAYDRLLKQFPAAKHFLPELIRKLIETRQYAKASKRLAPLLKEGSDETRAEMVLLEASIRFAQKEHQEALNYFLEAEKLHPAAVETVANRQLQGRILQGLGKTDEAVAAYQAAHGIDNKATEPLLALIPLLSRKDDAKPEALKLLQELANVAGDDPELVIQAANAYFELDRFQQAFDLAQRIAGDKPSSPVERLLGIASSRQSEFEKAAPHLEKVAKEDRDELFLQEAIETFLHRGDLAKVLEYAKEFEEFDPVKPLDTAAMKARVKALSLGDKKDPKAIELLVCAETLHEQGNPAAEILTLLNQIGPEVALGEAHALRAVLSIESGQLRRALPEAEKAIQLSPKGAEGYYARGRIRYEAGRKDATDDLRKAVELCGRKKVILLHWLAKSLLADGKDEEAKKVASEGAQLDPDNAEIAELRKELEKGKAIP